MRKSGLCGTRQRIDKFLHDFIDERGYAPTVRDILKGLGMSSTSVVQYHLDVLEREGRIRRDREVFRSIQLTDRKRMVQVPLLGSIAAGLPLPVINAETWSNEALELMDLPEELTKGEEVYALRVKGTSMIDALIDDGDILVMQPASTADDGEMVAVRLRAEEGVTLKRFYREPGRIRLQPANPTMRPIYSTPENVEVQGRVVGVIRML